jgi:hypothetical protein
MGFSGAANIDELFYLIGDYLTGNGYLTQLSYRCGHIAERLGTSGSGKEATAESQQAFVAMWFSKQKPMNCGKKGIEPGILQRVTIL